MTLCFLIVVKEDAFKQSFPCVYLMGLCMNDWGFPGSAVVKNLPANAGGARDMGWIPGLGRSLGVGNGNPLQFILAWKIPWDRGDWQATVHGVAKSQT